MAYDDTERTSGHDRPAVEPQNAGMLQETLPPKAGEVVSVGVPDGTSSTGARQSLAIVQPTQVRRPWRATVRTLFQGLVAFATLVPFVVVGVYDRDTDYPAVVVQVLAVSSAIARVMALPQVEAFLRRFLPFLSAAPNQK